MSGNEGTPLDPPESDPAMDDILASIRKILKDDDSPAGLVSQALSDGNSTLVGPMASGPTTAAAIAASALAFGAPPPPPVPPAKPPAPVLPPKAALPAVAPVPAPPAAVPAPAAVVPPPPVRPAGANPVAAPAQETMVSASNPPAAALPPGPGSVLNPSTAAATAASLGELIRAVAADRHVAVSRGAVTLEDIVREEMRPLIKDWLDRHLPLMVERLVRAEIERVVGRAMS